MGHFIYRYGITAAAFLIVAFILKISFQLDQISLPVFAGFVVLLGIGAGVWVSSAFRQNLRASENLILEIPSISSYTTGSKSQVIISNRELEVLQLIARGATNQQIADSLFISLNTVKTHAAGIYTKLGVSRRTQAVNKARELGILS